MFQGYELPFLKYNLLELHNLNFFINEFIFFERNINEFILYNLNKLYLGN